MAGVGADGPGGAALGFTTTAEVARRIALARRGEAADAMAAPALVIVDTADGERVVRQAVTSEVQDDGGRGTVDTRPAPMPLAVVLPAPPAPLPVPSLPVGVSLSAAARAVWCGVNASLGGGCAIHATDSVRGPSPAACACMWFASPMAALSDTVRKWCTQSTARGGGDGGGPPTGSAAPVVLCVTGTGVTTRDAVHAIHTAVRQGSAVGGGSGLCTLIHMAAHEVDGEDAAATLSAIASHLSTASTTATLSLTSRTGTSALWQTYSDEWRAVTPGLVGWKRGRGVMGDGGWGSTHATHRTRRPDGVDDDGSATNQEPEVDSWMDDESGEVGEAGEEGGHTLGPGVLSKSTGSLRHINARAASNVVAHLLRTCAAWRHPMVVVVEDMAPLVKPTRQTALYTMLELANATAGWAGSVNFVFLSRRPDVMDRLEKRLRSRFTSRSLLLPAPTLAHWVTMFHRALTLPPTHPAAPHWNARAFNATLAHLPHLQWRWRTGGSTGELFQLVHTAVSEVVDTSASRGDHHSLASTSGDHVGDAASRTVLVDAVMTAPAVQLILLAALYRLERDKPHSNSGDSHNRGTASARCAPHSTVITPLQLCDEYAVLASHAAQGGGSAAASLSTSITGGRWFLPHATLMREIGDLLLCNLIAVDAAAMPPHAAHAYGADVPGTVGAWATTVASNATEATSLPHTRLLPLHTTLPPATFKACIHRLQDGLASGLAAVLLRAAGGGGGGGSAILH